MCEIFDLAGFDGWSIGVLGVVDAVNYDNRYYYGVGITDTLVGLLFPTYGSYASEIGYAGPFYYYDTYFSASEPSVDSYIYTYSCLETYYGASADGMFSSYDMGYYVDGTYQTIGWRFMNKNNNGDDSHFEVGDQIGVWMLDTLNGNTENDSFVLNGGQAPFSVAAGTVSILLLTFWSG